MVSAAVRRSALLFVFAACSYGAVASTAQWDVRPTGADGNAGCFVPGGGGTDFSQQNAAQFSFADLASANGTNAAPQVTSASHNFAAADVGNCLHISAGTNWTTGWYQCVSAAANACTMDRAVGTVAALTAGTWAEGGALATLAGAGTATAQGTAGAGGPNASYPIGTVNIQSATYTLTATVTINSSGLWQGYQTTHGDKGTPPTITTATNSTDLIHIAGAGGNGPSLVFDNFTLTTTAATPASGIGPVSSGGTQFYGGFRNVSFSGFTTALNGSNSGAFSYWNELELSGVEVKNSTGFGVSNDEMIVVNGSWIHGNAGGGIRALQVPLGVADMLLVANSSISNNTGRGVDANGQFNCINSDIVSNTSDGAGIGTTFQGGVFSSSGCVYYGNGGFGVNVFNNPSNTNPYNFPFTPSRVNAYGANTSGPYGGLASAAPGDITLTANPFVSSTNFALNSTAGGGTLLKAAGFPGAFPGGATTGFISVGAAQPNPAGGACTGFCKLR